LTDRAVTDPVFLTEPVSVTVPLPFAVVVRLVSASDGTEVAATLVAASVIDVGRDPTGQLEGRHAAVLRPVVEALGRAGSRRPARGIRNVAVMDTTPRVPPVLFITSPTTRTTSPERVVRDD
jgi:hypothetical protein